MKEYAVILFENGQIEVTLCFTFKSAVKLYRELTQIYGKNKCKIFQEVVGFGETI